MGYSRRNKQERGVEDKFLKIPTRIFCFLNLPVEISDKTAPTLEILQNFTTFCGNSKAKNQGPCP